MPKYKWKKHKKLTHADFNTLNHYYRSFKEINFSGSEQLIISEDNTRLEKVEFYGIQNGEVRVNGEPLYEAAVQEIIYSACLNHTVQKGDIIELTGEGILFITELIPFLLTPHNINVAGININVNYEDTSWRLTCG